MTHRLPTIFAGGLSAAGGLVTYGTSVVESHRRIPAIIDAIWRGTGPADLPVEFHTKRELVFNQKVAEQLGIAISPALLSRADRVIR